MSSERSNDLSTKPDAAPVLQVLSQPSGSTQINSPVMPSSVAGERVTHQSRTLFLISGILIAFYGIYGLLFVNFSTDPDVNNVAILHVPAFLRSGLISLLAYFALAAGLVLLGVAKRRIGLGIGAAILSLLWTMSGILSTLFSWSYYLFNLYASDTSTAISSFPSLIFHAGCLWMLLAGLILIIKPRRSLTVGIVAIAISGLAFIENIIWYVGQIHAVNFSQAFIAVDFIVIPLLISACCFLIAIAAIVTAAKQP